MNEHAQPDLTVAYTIDGFHPQNGVSRERICTGAFKDLAKGRNNTGLCVSAANLTKLLEVYLTQPQGFYATYTQRALLSVMTR